MIEEYFLFSAKSLRRRQMRSWLTIIGIVIGIAAIVGLISIGEGMQNAIEDQFENMGLSNIRIVPANLRGPPTGDIGLDKSDAEFIESIVGVEYVDPLLMQYANVEFANEEQYIMVNGYDTGLGDKAFLDIDVDVVEGRLFLPSDSNSVIVGYDIAFDEDIFNKDIRVKNNIKIDDTDYRVIGIFEDMGNDMDNRIYMPLETTREHFNKPNIVNAITVKVLDGIDVEKVAETIERKLKRKHNGDEDFEVFTPAQLLTQFNMILGIVKAVLAGIAAISLIVGGIGIMNTMFTSVLERTREIGVMKAIGAKNSSILTIFMIESGIIGLIGGALGVIIGMGAAYMVEYGARLAGFGLLNININIGLVIFGLSFAFIVGVIAGTLPAIRASSLKPVDALRYE